ncbi:restriction endonuclease subunit S [Thalassoglobus sp. JC818]|uniref:restriction endonuclease subunit S n=1 Tax=Thalassoglobus sp. JC818 TaxID=3232136 RepID=UPI003458C18A
MIDGLTPYTDHKDSGLPWLGEIPAHWDVRRNGRLFVQRNQTGFPDLPILEVSLKTGVRVRDFENSNRKQVMADREKYKRARQGDIAYNMMRMWQGAVGTSPVDGLVSPAYVVAKPLPKTESRYYQYLFRTGAYMDEVNKFSRGIVSDRNRLYWEDFKQMPSPYPPPEEQAAIVRFLNHADRRIRRYIRAKRQLIALLNEQKQAIIHCAVTRGLDPHVKLKPSGVEWLGDVPEHWAVKKLRFNFRYAKGSKAAELTSEYVGRNEGPYPVYSGQTENEGLMGSVSWHEFDFEEPVILVTTVGARAMSTRVLSGKFSLSQNCAIIIPRKSSINVSFNEMAFQRMFAYEKATISLIMQPSLRFADLDRFYIPEPPPEEQTLIAKTVVAQIAELQNVCDQANEQLSLAREFRTRLIADVVTGKLDVREAAAALPDELEAVEPDAEELLDDGDTTDEVELDTEPEEVEA